MIDKLTKMEQRVAVIKTSQKYQTCVAEYRKICVEMKVLEKAQQVEAILNQLDTTNDAAVLLRLLSDARAIIRDYINEETAKSEAEWAKSQAECARAKEATAIADDVLREKFAAHDAKWQERFAADEAKWRELAQQTSARPKRLRRY